MSERSEIDIFKELCYSLEMDFVLDEDRPFEVKKGLDDQRHVYLNEGGYDKRYDDRGDLFVALRNVAVNIVPNCTFRSADYIYGNKKKRK